MSEALSRQAQEFFAAREERKRFEEHRKGSPRIQIAAVVGVLSYFYERVRTLIEFPDEELIRRRAIERILKRRLAISVQKGERFAYDLIVELITARYIPNDSIPEYSVKEVLGIVEKYQLLIQEFRSLKERPRSYGDLSISLASREIEETLTPRFEDEALLSFSQKILTPNIAIPEVPESLEAVLLEVVVRRIVLREDDHTILFHLLKKYSLSAANVVYFQKVFRHGALPFLLRRFRPLRPVFALLREFLFLPGEEFEKIVSSTEHLEKKIRGIIFERFEKASKQRFWSIVRALAYIFFTKAIFLLFLEIPYEHYAFGGVHAFPLMFNAVVPLLFIILLTIGVRQPKDEAVDLTTKEIISILTTGRLAELGKRLTRERKVWQRPILQGFFWFVYTIFSLGIFFAIGYGLTTLHFSPLAIGVFFIFMSLVGFFGFRIRATFWEVVPLPKKDNLFVTLFDLLVLPFVHLGQSLARTFSSLNSILIFFDFLIEVPFKAFFGILEDWFSFIKEKKEDITRG